MKTFNTAEIIKKRRQEAGITQEELSRLSGISRPTIGAYEEGRGCPSLYNLVKLMEGFGYSSIDAFLGDQVDLAQGKVHQVLNNYQRASFEQRDIVDFVLKVKK